MESMEAVAIFWYFLWLNREQQKMRARETTMGLDKM
jgi:hypothetical protein